MNHKLPLPIHVSEEEKKQQQRIGQLADDVSTAIDVANNQLNELMQTGRIEGRPVTFSDVAEYIAGEADVDLLSAEKFIMLVQNNSIN